MFDDEMLDAMYEETHDYDNLAEEQDWVEFWRGDYDCDEPDSKDWDNLEMGFDPYMGCYSDDC